MAVSGRKHSKLTETLLKGSVEDFDHKCDPCLTDDQHVEAHGFCVECEEYLCTNCFKFHQRTRALKHHELLDKDSMAKLETLPAVSTSEVLTERCSTHKSEVIKFFCIKHEVLGCTDCVTMDHRTCTIEYIPEKCADIGESDEYTDIMKKFDLKAKEADDVAKTAETRNKKIDDCHANVIKEITTFQKEIDERFDQLRQEIQSDADKKKTNDKGIIQSVLDACATHASDIKKLQSYVQANKTSRRNGQLYISIKRAEAKVKSDEVRKAEETLAKTNMQFTFERNSGLENYLSRQNILGKLTLSSILIKPKRQNTFEKLLKCIDINVRTNSDTSLCTITGCAVLSNGKLVLADSKNKKVKVVDRQSEAVVDEKALDVEPWDIVVLHSDQIAVTLRAKTQLLLMKTAKSLSTVNKILVDATPYGLAYHKDNLYVVCRRPNSVFVLDTQGNVQHMILVNEDVCRTPEYIAVSEDSKNIYINDIDNIYVVSITLQGDVSAVYKHNYLRGPRGMLMLDDGSLLVCTYWNDTIHHISGDLKQGQKVTDCLRWPCSICYSQHDHDDEVYIGGEGDMLEVYSVK